MTRAILFAPIIAALLFSACGGSSEESDDNEPQTVYTRVAANRTAEAKGTTPAGAEAAYATRTAKALAPATATAKPPTVTPSPTADPTPFSDKFLALLRDEAGLAGAGVQTVNTVRLNADGNVELEYKTRYSAQANQPDVSWQIIQLISIAAKDWTPTMTAVLFGSADLHVFVTTYSLTGSYRYQSTTNLAMLNKIGRKEMTYTEWVAASGAGFR